ncbi:MAG: hypothetical protein ACFB22_04110 [Rhodothalassiaceae bacterium]
MRLSRLVGFAATATALSSAPLAAQDPYEKADQSWISISGTAVEPTASSFTLDYGDGLITVEMDDWDTVGEAIAIQDGDRVTVYGLLDDDLFEAASIEAASVYVEDLNTYFYASAMDEEDVGAWDTRVVVSQTQVRGTVKTVDAEDGRFTMATNDGQTFKVETEYLSYNPLDAVGYQQLKQGHRVRVTGMLDKDFMEGRVLEATAVTTLSRSRSGDQASDDRAT